MQWHRSLRLVALALTGLCASLMAAQAFAQNFPNRPVTLIIPYAAGGITDISFRAIVQEMARPLGQAIVVDNRTGAGGRIGANAIMRAPKDGHIIGVFNSAIATNLYLMSSDFRPEPVKDYAPISRAIETYVIMVGNPSLPFRDVKGLVEFAKANPGKLNFGSSGLGTTGHLSFEMLRFATAIQATHIPYKGDAPAFTDVIAGQIQLAIVSASTKPFLESGKLFAIATTGPARWSLFPNTPTFQESGIKGYNASAWLGFVGPAGMAAEAVAKVNQATVAALQLPELRKKLQELGLEYGASTPEEFTAFIRADLERWGPIVRAANIRIE